MRFRLEIAIDCDDLGRRVTVRRRLESTGFGDVIGILESCDEQTFGIRDRAGRLHTIARDNVVAAKVVVPPER